MGTDYEKICPSASIRITKVAENVKYLAEAFHRDNNVTFAQFSNCVHQTASWVQCVWLSVWASFYIWQLRRGRDTRGPLVPSWLYQVRQAIAAFHLALCGTHLFSIDNATAHAHWAFTKRPVTEVTSMMLVMLVLELERMRGMVTSGVLFIYWLLVNIKHIFIVCVIVSQEDDGPEPLEFHFPRLQFALCLIQLVICCFTERIPLETGRQPCPEYRSSFPSKITCNWLNELLVLGQQKTLSRSDMFTLDERDQSSVIASRFEKSWENKMAQMGSVTRYEDFTTTDSMQPKQRELDKETKDGEGKDGLADTPGKHKISLLNVLLSTFAEEFLMCQFWRFTMLFLEFTHPILLGKFIEIAEDASTATWNGYLLCFVFLCNLLVKALLFHKHYMEMNRLSFRIRASLVSAIYKKTLTMSNKAKSESTLGEIMNVMSMDAMQIREYFMWVSEQIWVQPARLIITMALLYYRVGWAVVSGVLVVLVMMPINMLISQWMKRLEVEQKRHKDKRIKLLLDVINGIKMLKLYAWDMVFVDKVTSIRNDELGTQLRQNNLDAVSSFCWSVTPFSVSLMTFLTYVFLSENHQIGAQTIFVSLLLFGKLTTALDALSRLFTETAKLKVSLQRVEKLLYNEDMDLANVTHDMSEHAVCIENGTFYWDQAIGPCLKNINLTVPRGSLVAIVGAVGSGKSSLISSILGETVKLTGHVNVSDRIAYVSQQAWIQNDTLRNNIVFENIMDTAKYSCVLNACALTADLETLHQSDMTVIGEKGINLSGGQKQRVSLARAVYFNSDIYLLDDPLSAVDSHVGKHIFENVIGNEGLLQNKTRILVTHGIRWLPFMDKIVVISGGEISEAGAYEELMEHEGPFAKLMDTYITQNEGGDGDDLDEDVVQFKKDAIRRLNSLRSQESTDSNENADQNRESAGTKAIQNYTEQAQLRKRYGENRKRCYSDNYEQRYRPRTSSLSLASDVDISKLGENLTDNPSIVLTSMLDSVQDQIVLKSVETLTNNVQRSISTYDQQDTNTTDAYTERKVGEIINEAVETSDTRWVVAKSYISTLGSRMYVVVLSLYGLHHLLELRSGTLLTSWTSNRELNNLTMTPADSHKRHELNVYYLKMYAALGIGQAFITFVHTCIYARMKKKSAETIHRNMLISVVRAPMVFFDTTPIGRIIDRFSRDIDSADMRMPNLIKYLVICLMSFITSLCIIVYTMPGFVVVLLPVGISLYLIQKYILPTKRQLRHLERITRSPINNHFGETVNGASVIRAFGVQDRFVTETQKLIDQHHECSLVIMILDRWLAMRLEFIGALLVFTTAFFAMYSRATLGGALVGLAMNYALAIEGKVNWFIHLVAALQVRLVDVERIAEYTSLKSEADLKTDREPNNEWPEEGTVNIRCYSVRYRDGLDCVLRNIDMRVKSGEKIGIVGRTGAGKSSLAMSLFRLLEPATGDISIDGEDISKLGLHDLRSRLTILPQEPVLFSGSIRMNLDPLDEHTDDTIYTALRRAHLKAFVESLPGKLEYECGEGGQKFSVGQRQLVCLARSLLRKSKVLVLDEATAAVDMETDDLIQQTIRSEFKDSTVLAIAHRLNTVIDYDRILVLEHGQVKEFDTPKSLLQNQKSLFFQLAKDAGLV